MSRQTANPPQSPFYKGGGSGGEGARHHFFVKLGPPYPEPVKRPLRELNKAEQEVIARRRVAVYERMPDMLPFFKELHEAGMIDGWRGVGDVVLLNEGEEHETD